MVHEGSLKTLSPPLLPLIEDLISVEMVHKASNPPPPPPPPLSPTSAVVQPRRDRAGHVSLPNRLQGGGAGGRESGDDGLCGLCGTGIGVRGGALPEPAGLHG